MWPWIVGGIVALIALISMVAVIFVRGFVKRGTNQTATRPILEERASHTPTWQKSSYEPDGPAEQPPAEIFEKITYPSAVGPLVAYLTPDPKDGKKHPAMVWAHGGFGGIGSYLWEPALKSNDQSARVFREKSIVLMCPSWRAENENPGRFELFYGELNDYLAAIEHVKKLPYVDPDRVYIAGHSTGGTMVLLASVASGSFRAAFSLGGMTDGIQVMQDGVGYGNTPYPPFSTIDHRLRSPLRYTAFITKPTFYFEGGESVYHEGADRMKVVAATKKVPFEAFRLPGNHFDILHPMTTLVAEKILADTGAKCNISFTETEILFALDKYGVGSIKDLLTNWNSGAADLLKLLEETDPEETGIRKKDDLTAVTAAMKKVQAEAPQSEATVTVLAEFLSRHGSIENEELIPLSAIKIRAPLLAWGREWLASPNPDAKVQEAFVSFLATVAQDEEKESADLVVAAVRAGLAPESNEWSNVFESYYDEHEQVTRVMKEFSKDPPKSLMGILLLDAANQLCLDGWKGPHPYGSAKGEILLEEWLKQPKASFAVSATLGLAFVGDECRKRLLPAAYAYNDQKVKLEAAWVDLKHGGKEGLTMLQKACLEIPNSVLAQDYLEELDHEEDIPAAAREPAFAAQAKMHNWLAHPNELGEAPLTLDIYDQRELVWPPVHEDGKPQKKSPVALLKFTYKTDDKIKTGYGMVGGMTWSFFVEYPTPPSPESLYLQHCTLELNRETKSEKPAREEDSRAKALEQLRQANGTMFDGVSAEMPPTAP
jgi:acetyl esterase/lipase